MGRETKTFRQTNKAGRADASSYSRINRAGNQRKTVNVFKKGDYNKTKP